MQAMPMQQRFIFRLTKYTPKLLPVIAWSLIACLESSYAKQFLLNSVLDSASDTKALHDPEIVDLIAKGSVTAMHSTVEAFCRECAVAQIDMTAEARACRHKFQLLHGDDDKVVDITQSMTFRDEVPGTTLETIHGAGTLLMFSHWPQVLNAVKRALR
jgi:pimeloyl-ACP methyl ester carboxylesterase